MFMRFKYHNNNNIFFTYPHYLSYNRFDFGPYLHDSTFSNIYPHRYITYTRKKNYNDHSTRSYCSKY